MPAIMVKICKTDTYSGSYVVVETISAVCDCVPRIGEKVKIKGTDWDVHDVIHDMDEFSKLLWPIVVVK